MPKQIQYRAGSASSSYIKFREAVILSEAKNLTSGDETTLYMRFFAEFLLERSEGLRMTIKGVS